MEELTESLLAIVPQSVKRQAESDARKWRRSLRQHAGWIIEQYYKNLRKAPTRTEEAHRD